MLKTNTKRKGLAAVWMAAGILAFTAAGGLAVDSVLVMMVRSRLQSAVDGALMAGVRAPSDARSSTASSVFAANFPTGYLLTSSRSVSPLSNSGNVYSMTGTAVLPTFFMGLVNRNSLTVNATASVTLVPASDPVEMILIDEDTIDNGLSVIQTLSGNPVKCGNSNSARCVNDDIANLYVRTQLFTRGLNILPYSPLTLPTGQTGDEGLFRFTSPDPQTSQQNGATFTMAELLTATGAASNENNLDKIDDVFPMRTTEIQGMAGKKFCALVYDSDVSVDTSSHYAVLKGATMGITAFTVTSVGTASGSTLPGITVSLLSSAEVTSTCAAAKAYADLSVGASSAATVYRSQ